MGQEGPRGPRGSMGMSREFQGVKGAFSGSMGIAEGSRGSKGTPWGYQGIRRAHRGPVEVPGDQWVVQGLKGRLAGTRGPRGCQEIKGS